MVQLLLYPLPRGWAVKDPMESILDTAKIGEEAGKVVPNDARNPQPEKWACRGFIIATFAVQ